MRYLPLIFSLVSYISFAQEQDSTRIEINGGVQVYLDYGKLLTQPFDFESKLEFGIAYQFKQRFQPNFQYGMAEINPEDAIVNGTYSVKGTYWRAGLNYLIPLDISSFLFVGLKYASAEFDDRGSYQIESELWPTFEEEFQRTGFSATWYEIIFGSERLMRNGHFILGGQTGVRIMQERSEDEFIDIYSVPGYGYTSDKRSPFINLYVKYQF